MPKIAYIEKRFNRRSRVIIQQANEIIREYLAEGYDLTLRQLYYQFVSRDLIPNQTKEYRRLGSVINDARLAGLIDWNAITDRTRNLKALSHWDSAQEMMETISNQFRFDRWDGQPWRIEVWIEKEALAGVFEKVCRSYDVPFFSCRGYTSQSEMWRAAMRLNHYVHEGQRPLILHFGDHDPSGIDMTRDIRDRMRTFGCPVDIKRIALNMDQIDQYAPPPNPAKLTDSRAADYVAEFGYESWELDALNPTTLADLVSSEVDACIDKDAWDAREAEEERIREAFATIGERWHDVLSCVEKD